MPDKACSQYWLHTHNNKIIFFVMRLLSELIMKDRLVTGALTALLIFLSTDHPYILQGVLGFLLVLGLLALNVDRISAWNEKYLKKRSTQLDKELNVRKRDKGE